MRAVGRACRSGLQLIGARLVRGRRCSALARAYEAITADADWRRVEPHDLARLEDPATPTPAERIAAAARSRAERDGRVQASRGVDGDHRPSSRRPCVRPRVRCSEVCIVLQATSSIGSAVVGDSWHAVYRRRGRWRATWGDRPGRGRDGRCRATSLCPSRPRSTRAAITIDAPPDAVWPWLVQMGYGRGGWYSYDALDMSGRSADGILPEWQALAVGDIVPTDPSGGFVVKGVEPGPRARPRTSTTAMIAGQSPGRGRWPSRGARARGVRRVHGGGDAAASSRLAGRSSSSRRRRPDPADRARSAPGSGRDRDELRAVGPVLGFGVFLMTRRQLLGIRQRAERAGGRAPATGRSTASWSRTSAPSDTPIDRLSVGRDVLDERSIVADASDAGLRPAAPSNAPARRDGVDAVRFAHDVRDRRPRRRSPSVPSPSASGPCRRPGIRRFFDILATMDDVISLGVGEPDFDTPREIVEAGVESLREGRTHYTSQLRHDRAAARARGPPGAPYGVRYDPATEILVTVGASEAVDLALRATCDPGDEVILHEPSYVAYVPAIVFAGGTSVHVATRFEDDFALDPAAVEAAITPRTKALFLGYPATRPAPCSTTTSRTSSPGSPRATTCSSTATRSTTASPTARTATGRSARCPACASGRSSWAASRRPTR